MAKYEACGLGIQVAIDFKVKQLKVYGDSRDHKLIPYQAYMKKLTKFFNHTLADALATLASMFQLTPHGDLLYIEFRCYGKPVHCCLIEEEQDGKPWYFDIKRYIEDREYPHEASENNKRML